jgi:filamentous hemagglutinin
MRQFTLRSIKRILVLTAALSATSCGIYALSDGSGCFVAGTPISTPDGPRAIELLGPGDSVYSWDKDSDQIVIGVVEALIVHEKTKPWTLTLSNGKTLRVTPEHPLYQSGQNIWAPVSQLKTGDQLRHLDEQTRQPGALAITSIEAQDVEERTFNIKVRRYENSFAGGLLAHFY